MSNQLSNHSNDSATNGTELMPGAVVLPDAGSINATFFEEQWATTHAWKQRFQFNLELARKDFLHVLAQVRIPRANQTILDVGFGNGMLTFLFNRSCHLYGTELSPAAIRSANERAQREGYASYSFVTPPPDKPFPFEANFFDVVVASHVVEHVTEDIAFLKGMLGVTKPGGHVIVLIPLDSKTDGVLTEDQLINPDHINLGHYHVRNYNMETFLNRLQQVPGEVVFATADAYTWDWKASSHEKRAKLAGNGPGRVLDRLIAAGLNIPLSTMPRPCLAGLDKVFAKLGYRPRQAAVAIRKPA